MSEEQPCPMLWHSSIPMSCRQTQQLLLRLSIQISNSGLQLVGKQWKSAKIENFTNQPVTGRGRGGGVYKKRFWSAPCRIAWICTFNAVWESGRVQNKEFTCGKCDRVWMWVRALCDSVGSQSGLCQHTSHIATWVCQHDHGDRDDNDDCWCSGTFRLSVYFILLRQHHQHHHHSHINDNNHLAQSQHKRRCLLEKLETPPHIGKNKNAPLKTWKAEFDRKKEIWYWLWL